MYVLNVFFEPVVKFVKFLFMNVMVISVIMSIGVTMLVDFILI